MADKLRVVRGSCEHLDALVPLFDDYRQFYDQKGDLEGARTFLEERLSLNESVVFMALHGDTPVGFTQLFPSFSSVSMQRLWILNDLYVRPAWRGRRVGERLLEAASELARASGAKGVQLETAIDNVSAQRLYERYGYKRDTEFHHYAWTTPASGGGSA